MNIHRFNRGPLDVRVFHNPGSHLLVLPRVFGKMLPPVTVVYVRQADKYYDYRQRLWEFRHWLKYDNPAYGVLYDLLGVRFITAYALEYMFGGPEEGGWWYSRLTPLETRIAHEWNAQKVKHQLAYKYDHLATPEGMRYTDVNCGYDMQVRIEEKPMESTTWVRPHYE